MSTVASMLRQYILCSGRIASDLKKMWLQSSDHKYMIVFQVITMGGKILISEFIKAAKLFMPLWFSDDANVSIFSGSDNTFSSIPSGWDHRGEKRAKKARKVNIATSFYIYIGSTILVEYYQPQTLSSFPHHHHQNWGHIVILE